MRGLRAAGSIRANSPKLKNHRLSRWMFIGAAGRGLRIGAKLFEHEPCPHEETKENTILAGSRFEPPKQYQKEHTPKCVLFLVPLVGLEPTRYRYHWILSPARLPISPQRRQQCNYNIIAAFLQAILVHFLRSRHFFDSLAQFSRCGHRRRKKIGLKGCR